jgi:hypothetical protein
MRLWCRYTLFGFTERNGRKKFHHKAHIFGGERKIGGFKKKGVGKNRKK